MKFKILKSVVLVFLGLLLVVNVYLSVFDHDPVLEAKKKMVSLSAGERYYGRLQLWYLLAVKGDWTDASTLEPQLDQADIIGFKSQNNPAELQKRLDFLMGKNDKSTDDWMELARLQYKFNQPENAAESINRAHKLDPVRDDIQKLYFSSPDSSDSSPVF